MTFRDAGGCILRFHPSAVSAALWEDPSFRHDDVDVCSALLKPGDFYVDVGANIGQLAMAAAVRVGRTGRIVAIEPHPRTCDFLRENMALNDLDWIVVKNTAVGAADGRAAFTNLSCDDQNYIAPASAPGDHVEVAVTTLDSLVSEGHVRLLKIDVEGFEMSVLAGARRLLTRCDCVYIEESPHNLARFGASASEMRDCLRGAGFRIFLVNGRRLAEDPAYPDGDGGQNLLAIRQDCVGEVQARFAPRLGREHNALAAVRETGHHDSQNSGPSSLTE